MRTKQLLKLCVAVLCFTAISCVEKRPDIEAQGSNLGDLLSASEIMSWDHSISTGAKIEGMSVSEAEDLDVPPEMAKHGVSFPSVVSFTTDSTLLKANTSAIDFFGRPDTAYKLVYKLTPNFLKIYKIVPSDELSHYEVPYAVKQDNGDYMVPIGGYRANYFNRNFVKNSDNRDSNIESKYSVPRKDYKSAGYVSIDRQNFIPFGRVTKLDVLPASYFTDGKWYYASSTITTKPGEESKIGYVDGSVDASLRKLATKIRFVKINNFLRGVNVVRDERSEVNDDQADDVINIRVDWEEYRARPMSNTEVDLREERNPLVEEVARTYGKFHFAQTLILEQTSQRDAFLQGVFKGIKINSLRIKPNSFSYTLTKTATGETVKYSFLRAGERDFKPRVYLKEDRKRFGLFPVDKFKLADHADHRDGDFEKNVLMSRLNPNKDVYFRFSTLTPKIEDLEKDPYRLNIDYRKIGREAVSHWARAFELIDMPNRLIVLDEDSELGELDVNVINIVDNLGAGSTLGVGPTVTDPETGEIISGTVNVYVGPVRNSAAHDIRNYIKVKSGMATDIGFSKNIIDTRPLMAYVTKEIEKFCPEVEKFAASEDAKNQYVSTVENKYVDSCLLKILPKRLAAVVSHEMGHSPFGLRHNFYGSSDKKNSIITMDLLESMYPRERFPEIHGYYPSEEFLPAGSAMMDYSPFSVPFLVMPSYYDIAALAFAYAGKVESSSVQFTKGSVGNARIPGKLSWIPIDMSVALENQEVYQRHAQKFKYCTDNDARKVKVDPLCKLHDYGYTPLEALDYHFDAYRDNLVLYGRKLDRGGGIRDYGPFRTQRFLSSMAEIYSAYRSYVYDYVGDQRAYLDFMSPEMSRNFVETLKSDVSFSHPDYIGVSQKYYDLISEILFLPDYYCVAIDADTKVSKLMEFSKLQKQVIGATGVFEVRGCEDQNLIDYVESSQGLKVVTSVGLPIESVQFSLDIDDATESYDIIGIGKERSVVQGFITARLPPKVSYLLIVRGGFQPSVLDESHLYDQLREKLTTRLFDGLDIKSSLSGTLKGLGYDFEEEDIPLYPKFDSEWGIYTNAWASLVNSAFVPGKPTRPSIKDFQARKTTSVADINPGASVFKHNGSYYYAEPSAVFTVELFNKLRQFTQPFHAKLDGVLPQQQRAFDSFYTLVAEMPEDGKVSARKLFTFVTDLQTEIQRTTDIVEKQALQKGGQELIEFFEQFRELASITQGQAPMPDGGVSFGGMQMNTTDEVSALVRPLFASEDLAASLKEKAKMDIQFGQKSLVSQFVSGLGPAVFTSWNQKMNQKGDKADSVDPDTQQDLQIQKENLLNLLNGLPGV